MVEARIVLALVIIAERKLSRDAKEFPIIVTDQADIEHFDLIESRIPMMTMMSSQIKDCRIYVL